MEACRWKVCPEITLLHTSPAWPSTSVIWIRAVFVRPLRADTLTDSLHKQAAPCSVRVNEPWQKTPWHQLQMLLVQAFFCVSHACLEGLVFLPAGQTHSLVDVIPKMNYDTPEYIIDSITPKLNINQQGCKPCSNQFSFSSWWAPRLWQNPGVQILHAKSSEDHVPNLQNIQNPSSFLTYKTA